MSKQVKSPPPTTPADVYYCLSSGALSYLEGQILTLLEASIADAEQRTAVKSLFRPMVWRWAIEHNNGTYNHPIQSLK